jgi:hypothetical protein
MNHHAQAPRRSKSKNAVQTPVEEVCTGPELGRGRLRTQGNLGAAFGCG